MTMKKTRLDEKRVVSFWSDGVDRLRCLAPIRGRPHARDPEARNIAVDADALQKDLIVEILKKLRQRNLECWYKKPKQQ